MSAQARFRAAMEQADAKASGPDADAVDECEALRWAVEAADDIVSELAALAVYANGKSDPDWPADEPDYPSGADMVDYVNEMLTRLGFADETTQEPAPEPTFGCVECGYTGLHADISAIEAGAAVIYDVQRHDECGALDGDLSAARFIALVHPQYKYISYPAADGSTVVLMPAYPEDWNSLPDIAAEAPVCLSTADGFFEMRDYVMSWWR